MDDIKSIKDPIYGYIDIKKEYTSKIIDTATFQRLRRIIQTSYSPLYASSIHNRFIHSLGVFHLGQLAVNSILKKSELSSMPIEFIESVNQTFLLACLLHDVGHAPFSHTGEKFYLDNGTDYNSMHDMLKSSVDSVSFTKDIPVSSNDAAAPHEIMSVIIGIKDFSEFLPTDIDREFFARCITGYKYSDSSKKSSFLNCYIGLLNSKVIDVDRLDYLIRDAFFTGFNTISIDYIRLLNSISIKEINGKYEIVYLKNAISVIENVVYAHDSERKWIQNHPIVLYDIYIIQHIISKLNDLYNGEKKLFSMNALTSDGINIEENINICLLSDDDIVFLLKNKVNDALSAEYFNRNIRRKPIWKSEAEYRTYFASKIKEGSILNDFENALKDTEKYVTKNSDNWIINENLVKSLEQDIASIEQTNVFEEEERQEQLKSKNNILKVFNVLRDYAAKENVECDYVILSAKQFYSNFSKTDVAKLKIQFGNVVKDFGDVVTILNSNENWRKDFFYIYYNGNLKIEFDKKAFSSDLLKAFWEN